MSGMIDLGVEKIHQFETPLKPKTKLTEVAWQVFMLHSMAGSNKFAYHVTYDGVQPIKDCEIF
jgi:hypothetical protein